MASWCSIWRRSSCRSTARTTRQLYVSANGYMTFGAVVFGLHAVRPRDDLRPAEARWVLVRPGRRTDSPSSATIDSTATPTAPGYVRINFTNIPDCERSRIPAHVLDADLDHRSRPDRPRRDQRGRASTIRSPGSAPEPAARRFPRRTSRRCSRRTRTSALRSRASISGSGTRSRTRTTRSRTTRTTSPAKSSPPFRWAAEASRRRRAST